MQLLVLILLLVLGSALACASGSCKRSDYRGASCRAKAARETLAFGLSREAALDAIGRSEVTPPWSNPLGLGPATIRNPFDSESVTSPIGEGYEVVRYYVEATGDPKCPFVQGALVFEPLIFIDDKLVGWSWAYLAEVLGERVPPEKTRWEFGAFCEGRRNGAPAERPESDAPEATPSASD